MNNKQNDKKISNAVIRRLPRYFRYLREIIRNAQAVIDDIHKALDEAHAKYTI